MKIAKKDWLFIALIAGVLAVFLTISGKETTKVVPNNDMHRPVYEIAFKDAPKADASIFKKAFFKPNKKDAERFCEPCHESSGIKLPPNHPPKNRCLFCHKFAR
jgi:hypothetical protein